jgi:hypothetical protein
VVPRHVRGALNSMLALRQIIPPLTVRTADGSFVRAWDFKQKNSLLVAFLHLDCPNCMALLTDFSARAGEISALEAVALVVFLEALPLRLLMPEPIVLASDISGRGAREYLGADPFGSKGLSQVGVFVTDRYGELRGQWQARESTELPELEDMIGPLRQCAIEC